MSYCVEYNPEFKKRYPFVQRKIKKPKVKTVLLLLFVCIAAYTAFRCDLIYYLIPGEPNVTIDAVSGMLEQIKAGETVRDAMQCFVETVIQNGK